MHNSSPLLPAQYLLRAMILSLLLFLAGTMLPAGIYAAGRVMSDAELDEVVAGTVDSQIQDDILRFHYLAPAGSNHTAELDGSLSMSRRSRFGNSSNLLVIDNGAQTNLRSVVNINAVSSEVNVLINLNININSTVGELRQINIRSVQ